MNDLLSTTLTEEGVQARNETFYRLVEFLAARWAAQVLGGISDPDNQGVTRARREEDFAKLLVQGTGTSFLLAWDKGTHSMNMMLSYEEFIERLDVKGTSLHKDKDEDRKALNERMLEGFCVTGAKQRQVPPPFPCRYPSRFLPRPVLR